MLILGIDLGITSIGWSLINTAPNGQKTIVGLGTRIIPLSSDDKDEFSSGKTISKNQIRTIKRTQRKRYDRYQLRRKALTSLLAQHNMLPNSDLFHLSATELFGLRAKAVHEKISLVQLGRIFYHLNQKRGYKSSRNDVMIDKKETAYVEAVKNKYEQLKEAGQTIGEFFYSRLTKDPFYKIKQQVYPREAYLEEFDSICTTQKKFHPELRDDVIAQFRNNIIYFQRKLKSQKNLVSICELAGFNITTKEGKTVFAGPSVAPKSSPLFQVCRIWELINNITIKNKRGEIYNIPLEKKATLFDYLDNHAKLSEAELFKLLELKKEDGWYGNKQLKELQGNVTKSIIKQQLDAYPDAVDLLRFTLQIEQLNSPTFLTDKKTGEVTYSTTQKSISKNFEHEPLYRLWHVIYSIDDLGDCTRILQQKFNLPESIAEKLASIDFKRLSFSNKSAKAIRSMLPYLMDGFVYSSACTLAGYNHSGSLTKEEKNSQSLLPLLPVLNKNSIRQPVVEKILNQMINLVNAIITQYGRPDEIRVELARELKQSKEERNETFAYLTRREKENRQIIERIESEYKSYGIRATKNNIIKWRLFHETTNTEIKTNATCIYCGQHFGLAEALGGNNIDVEHIIPKSKLFDDSQSNKTLSHRKCNEDKGNRTAYDFMKSKGEQAFQQYLELIDNLYKDKIISKSKRDKLLTAGDKIPQDFIERQLRETQYISKKAKEVLSQICHNVFTTSGSVTEYLRRIWGWNEVLVNLQLPKYRKMGLTEWKEWETIDGQRHQKEIIKDWSKRDDYRHHAIDALTIACTRQGFIQRINTLNASSTRTEMMKAIETTGKNYDPKKSLLENYFYNVQPFTTSQVEQAVANIAISFKAGKKGATTGTRKIKRKNKKEIVQRGIIVPRGALSEESVYGKIKTIEKNKPIKHIFQHPHTIVHPYIKQLVEERLHLHNNDLKKALASLVKDPIYLDEAKTRVLTYGSCYREEYVMKYPVETLRAKDIPFIVDGGIKAAIEARLLLFNNKEKEAFKDLENHPIWQNEDKKIPIKSVRLYTNLSIVEPIKKNMSGTDIGFVKPGSNHHIAIYKDEKGNKQEHICSFWHAVERKKHGFPLIIKDPKAIWDQVLTSNIIYPDSFLSKLPSDKYCFEVSLQQNEMFIFGLTREEIAKNITEKNKSKLSECLFRVRKLTSGAYWFQHHLETQPRETMADKKANRAIQASLSSFNGIKVQVNILGEITLQS
jgi:CRISPR-associated endonuclease Csn1